MKKLSGILGILLASTMASLAIEGLKIAVQSDNVILSWPSATNETYLVQYRPTLNSTSSWLTVTDDFPAAVNTNITFFVQSNSVNYPDLMLGDSGSGSEAASEEADIMAMPANGSGDAVPLILYPQGFDLSALIIFDPATGEWVSGKGYTISSPSGNDVQAGGAQPDDGSGDTNSYTGFYRVVADGVQMYGITNGMVVSNELITPIEFAVDSTDQIVGVTFYDENTNPIVGATAQPFGGNAWLLVWNTTLSLNGDYTIYAELNFASDTSVVGQPVTVTVDNTISFPNYFSQVFGSQMWIYAQTIPDASYEIDIYDENTNYLGSFDDYADDNGVISFLWNLVDGDGVMHDDTNFFGVFTVDTSSPDILTNMQTKTITAGTPHFQTGSLMKKTLSNKIKANGIHPDSGSSASANQLWVKEGSWTPNNNWVVAYGLFNGQSGESSQNDIYMICGGPGGEYGGALGTLDQYGLNGNVSPGNSAENETVFTLDDATSRSNLLSYLASTQPQYENFYFFGHGNDSAIGSYNGFTLTSDQIASALGNVPLSYNSLTYMHLFGFPITMTTTFDTTIQHAAEHPYRFVFIDACDTGAGNFCEAFGIPAQTLSTNNFAAQGVESRAFVGMKSWKLNLDVLTWENYSLMTGYFLTDWLNGVNLQTCVNNAKNDAHETGAEMSSSAVIYGASDLTRGVHTP
jgi:hypothetical protein